METTKVITDDIRDEANKWRRLSHQMSQLQSVLAAGHMDLGAAAFFIGPTEMASTIAHSSAYNDYLEHIRKLVSGAVIEWEQLGDALNRMADEFDRTDQTAMADLDKIYTQP